MNKVSLSKKKIYGSKLIVIDGFSGCGKILIAELIKPFKNTEIARIEGNFDYLPIMHSFGLIEKNTAHAFLQTLFDRLTYYMLIGREINLRKKDLTFALDHPNKFRYIKAIFSKPEEDKVIEQNIAPIKHLPYMVHKTTFNNTLLEECFKDRIKIIYALRDPLFFLETYSSHIDRIENDPREFTPKISYKGHDLPWYANTWEEEYLKINNTERSIVLIKRCLEMLENKLSSKYDKKIHHIVFFEDITINTDQKFMEIKDFLNLEYSKSEYARIKKKNKIPRLNQNIMEGFWKRYTTNNESRDGYDEKMLLERVKGLVSSHYFEELLKTREKYISLKQKYK